jgi:hypothetical protein
MKKVLNVLPFAIVVIILFIVGQSFYWEHKASGTEMKSYYLMEVRQSDMKANFRRIDEGLPAKEDTVLTNAIDEMQRKMKLQRSKSILYKLFGWKVG